MATKKGSHRPPAKAGSKGPVPYVEAGMEFPKPPHKPPKPPKPPSKPPSKPGKKK